MPRRKKNKAVPFNASDITSIRENPYVSRLIDDASLRDKVKEAVDSSKNVYERIADGKTSPKALLEDKKMQSEFRNALEAIRDVTIALTDAPAKQARKKGLKLGSPIIVLGLGGGLALVGSEKLRSKVLDVLFGAEEEFEYTPPATTPPTAAPAAPAGTGTPAGAA
jgi:hypothetical protein